MSRATIILTNDQTWARALSWVRSAPRGTRLEFKEAKRTTDQNARMWAMLTELASQVRWHGLRLSADDWKLIMLDALKREVRMVPNIDGNGFVNLGRSSSDLSRAEMADLRTLIEMFAAKHGVQFKFSDDETEAA